MRKEIRNCDTGAWIGGRLSMHREFVTTSVFSTDWEKDLCPGCADAIGRFIEELEEIEEQKKTK